MGQALHTKALSLARFGLRLGTRLEGSTIRSLLWGELHNLSQPGLLVVDLAGLEVLSGSFADEVLGEVLASLVEGDLPGRYILVRSPGEELLEDVRTKLLARKLPLLAAVGEGSRWSVLGKLQPYLGEALEWVVEHGEATSQDLACALGLTVQQASMRLLALGRLRLVHLEQESRPAGGYRWRAVSLLAFITAG